MLYNFKDSPRDLFERMRLNVALNEELDIRIFSFPMRYQPVNRQDRSHVGVKWNSYYLRSMQVILQATHGIVSGAPEFFRTAYGDTFEEFENILLRPHHYIFNRHWYEQFDGRDEFEAFQSVMRTLSENEKTDLLDYLCSRDKNCYEADLGELAAGHLRNAAHFFVPMPKADEARIWEARKHRSVEDISAYLVPEDERVEDAALTDEGRATGTEGKTKLSKRSHKFTHKPITEGFGAMIEAKRTEEEILDTHEVLVGKDVLELLSSSMYVNPLMIFREYVQNATDAIDDATKVGLLASIADGRIEINLDHIDRRVVIRDNGIGLSNAEFPMRMLSFGASAKRGTDARGVSGCRETFGSWLCPKTCFSRAFEG